METTKRITASAKAVEVAYNLFLLVIGAAFCAVAINGILIPHNFLAGGFTGLALFIHYHFPYLPVSLLLLFFNVPVFVAGWAFVGRRFFFYSLVGALTFTAAIEFVQVQVPVHDAIVAVLLAGIINGIGAGITLRSFGSPGGLAVLSVIVFKKFSVKLGTTVLAFNAFVVACGAYLFGLDVAIYTLIFIFVTSKTVDLVVTGLSQRKSVMIVSERWEDIKRFILEDIERGVTVLEAHGGYNERDDKVLYTVITFSELTRLKHEVRHLDPTAFLVVSETLEVMGQRIGNQPHW